MFKVLFAKQKKLPWKPKKDRGAKPCLSRFPRELRVRYFARDARPIRPSARLLFPVATPHQRRDGCLAIHLYVFHYTSLRRLKQYQFSRRRRSEPISSHLWAEINSKKVRSHPLKSRRQKKYTKEKGCHSNMRCTPSTRHAHFAAHQKYVIVCRRFLVFMGFPDAFLPPCTPCTPFFQ